MLPADTLISRHPNASTPRAQVFNAFDLAGTGSIDYTKLLPPLFKLDREEGEVLWQVQDHVGLVKAIRSRDGSTRLEREVMG